MVRFPDVKQSIDDGRTYWNMYENSKRGLPLFAVHSGTDAD